jgi:alpha-glucosidase (family GH31 glycosyl hydrolase)
VVAEPQSGLNTSFLDAGDYYELRAVAAGPPHAEAEGGVTLRASKRPLRLTMWRHGKLLWAEASGLAMNTTASFQTLSAQSDESFFGGGMQNGRFTHRGHRIRISTDYNWAEGGNPNAAPVFLSSAGYAVFRNTWSPGFYDFSESPVVLGHNESRFDAFYVAAAPRDFKALLEGYTFVTGRPFLPPIYGLGLGDSDCYHNARHGNDTHVVVAMAEKYRKEDMPGAWILPNDGYGCGFGVGPVDFPSNFSTLDEVSAALRRRGFVLGLWSSTGLPNISREVAGSGALIAKTDVGWIGNGYKFAFDAVSTVVKGIETNSDARRFIWTVEGWAATHRLAVMWTGYDSGSFDYIRWQIPTFVGAGFSAQAHVSGDVDGIFGGSPETYVRDLQFKCFMTVMMSMSGWAANPDKQPWTWGEPYTSINRMYLKLKMRLLPYFYTLSRTAHDTGVPPVRALALEFPDDVTTFADHPGSSLEFMAGPSFLVAPVYQPLGETTTRDGIYLPAGAWVDYWNGSIYTGPKTINGYPAPLEKLPVFVRAGAIVPMWPTMHFPGELPPNPLTLDVYPSGNSSFELYEDDGVTRKALEEAAFVKTMIACRASPNALASGGRVVITVGAALGGGYRGQLVNRSYIARVHMQRPPEQVWLANLEHEWSPRALPKHNSESEWDFAQSGWFFSTATLGGLVRVKTPELPTDAAFRLELSDGPQYPRIAMRTCNATAPDQAFVFDPASGSIQHGTGSCLAVGDQQDLDSHTPAVELLPCAGGAGRRGQSWRLDGRTGNLHPGGDPTKCVDIDHADRMAEIYSCYSPATPNQRFAFRPDGSGAGHHSGSFVSVQDGSCMTVVPVSGRWRDDERAHAAVPVFV